MYGMPRAVEMRPVVTWTLLAVNLVLWLAMEAAGGSGNPDVLLDFGATHAPYVSAGEYWRLLTSIFLHAGLMHLLFNSIGLLMFGRIVERSTATSASRSYTCWRASEEGSPASC